jgi:molecular chaperone GrpE
MGHQPENNLEHQPDTAAESPQAEPEALEQAPLSAEQLAGLLEDARAKADDHWNQLLRARADIENERRRLQRDVENAHKFGIEKFALELLPVKDSLELGLASAAEGADAEKLREGMDLTLKMLRGALEKVGISELDPGGEKFNPELHEAMTTQETGEVEPNSVVTVYQKGYLLNGRLLRPALVVVSKAPASSAPGTA